MSPLFVTVTALVESDGGLYQTRVFGQVKNSQWLGRVDIYARCVRSRRGEEDPYRIRYGNSIALVIHSLDLN